MPKRIDPHDLYFGWEEIAQAFLVTERTARRYEATEGLVVRRLATGQRSKRDGGARGRVYATGRMLLDFIERGGRHRGAG